MKGPKSGVRYNLLRKCLLECNLDKKSFRKDVGLVDSRIIFCLNKSSRDVLRVFWPQGDK